VEEHSFRGGDIEFYGKFIHIAPMVPIALDPVNTRLAVAGNGRLALRRLRGLRAGGAGDALLFADAAEAELAEEAGVALRRRLPQAADLAALHVLWIVDLAEDVADELAARARAARVLVNVEDRPAVCDFHSVAELRRGDLLLTVSTGGAAPGLAGSIRRNLQNCFGDEWAARVNEVAGLRAGWRAAGVAMPEAARRIDTLVDDRCWISCPKH
jgi:precorrin-2 dehydrogenase/sirohydrochlorin ferrochelatase